MPQPTWDELWLERCRGRDLMAALTEYAKDLTHALQKAGIGPSLEHYEMRRLFPEKLNPQKEK